MLRSALVLLGAGFLLASCSPSEPKKAKDETEHKLHDDPAIVRFRLTKATLKDLGKWAEQPTLADIEPSTEQQEMSLSLTRDGFLAHKDKGVEEFKVESTTSSPSTVYLLEVFYTDAQGRPMNHQFIDNGQDRIHQHFFRRYTERVLGGKARIYPINKLEELRLSLRRHHTLGQALHLAREPLHGREQSYGLQGTDPLHGGRPALPPDDPAHARP